MSLVAIAGQTFRLRVELESQSAAGTFQSSPTVAAGDVKLLILPASPAGTETYANSTNAPTLLNGPTAEVIIAAAETTAAGDGGEIIAVWADAAGAQWYSLAAHVQVKAADVAVAGDEMDLVDAPNATAVAEIQNGLATYGEVADVLSSVNAQTAIQIGMIQAVVGAKGNRAAVASAGTITGGSEQSGTYASTKALDNQQVWQVGGSTTIDFYLEFDVPEGAVLRAVVVRAECNNNLIPTYYISNNASDWTSIGQQSEAVPDDYEVDTLIVPVADAVTAGASGKLYVRLTAGYYVPLTVQVSYLAIVVEDAASGGGSSAQEVWEYTTRTLTQSSTGSGATAYSITVQDEDSNPIDGVEVWITTDSAGTNVVAGTLSTDALGLATFMLDAGDYYVWRQRSGYNFTNPVAITVS